MRFKAAVAHVLRNGDFLKAVAALGIEERLPVDEKDAPIQRKSPGTSGSDSSLSFTISAPAKLNATAAAWSSDRSPSSHCKRCRVADAWKRRSSASPDALRQLFSPYFFAPRAISSAHRFRNARSIKSYR